RGRFERDSARDPAVRPRVGTEGAARGAVRVGREAPAVPDDRRALRLAAGWRAQGRDWPGPGAAHGTSGRHVEWESSYDCPEYLAPGCRPFAGAGLRQR